MAPVCNVAEAMAAGEALPADLENLDLSKCNLTPQTFAALRLNERAVGLRILRLSTNSKLFKKAADVEAVVATFPSTLEDLDLRSCELTPNVFDTLRIRVRAPHLRRLNLDRSPELFKKTAYAKILAEALPATVEELFVSGCGLTPEVFAALGLRERRAPGIRCLGLLGNERLLRTKADAEIVAAALPGELDLLDLSWCALTPEVFAALGLRLRDARSGPQRLELRGHTNGLLHTAADAAVVATAIPEALDELDISLCTLMPDALLGLGLRECVPRLRRLEVYGNHERLFRSLAEIEVFAAELPFESLEELDFRWCELSPARFAALGLRGRGQGLKRLQLGTNKNLIGNPADAVAVGKALPANLVELDLSLCAMNPKAFAALHIREQLPYLRRLALDRNKELMKTQIGATLSAEALPPSHQLDRLTVFGCGFSDLPEAERPEKLKELQRSGRLSDDHEGLMGTAG